MAILIKNARTPNFEPIEILIDGGRVAEVGERLSAPPDAEIIDAAGGVAAAGVTDMHVHLRDPGFRHKEDIESGCAAAVAGGVSAVACMPNTDPVADSPDVLRYIAEKAAAQGLARVYPIAAITKGERGEELTDFEALARAGAVAFSDDGRPVMSRELMREAMLRADALGLRVISHCEDFDFKKPYSASELDARLGADLYLTNMEESMVARDAALALETGAPVHIAHISTAVSAEVVRRAKSLGARISCETCPHYLLLDESEVRRKGANAKMNPPLRTPADREALRRAVCDGTVDAIASDHAPHTAAEKAQPLDKAPNGIIGLETLVCGALTAMRGRMPLDALLEKLTAAPRRLLGLEPQGLERGARADITIIDPDEEWVYADIRSRASNTPFVGEKFVGRARATLVGGRIVYQIR